MNPAYKKEWQRLAALIYANNTVIRPDYIVGFYRYWARTQAIEHVLVKKGIITIAEIEKEELPLIKEMQNDFNRILRLSSKQKSSLKSR